MSLRQQAAKGVVWTAVQTWGARLTSFLVTLVLVRLLLPEDFGLVAYATVFIAFAQIFLDQGFSDAIVQCPNLEREHLDTAFWTNLLTGCLLTALGLLGAAPLARLLARPELAPVLAGLSAGFLFGSLSSVQQAILKRNLAFKSLALRSLVATGISGLVAIGMALLGCGVWSLVAKLLVNGLVGVIVLWGVSDWRPGLHFSLRHFKELFRFGVNILGSSFAEFLSRNMDNFLIGTFLGATALGYYTLAYNLLSVISELMFAVPSMVVFPTFARLQGEPERMRQPFYEVTQLQSIVAFPIFLGVLALAPEAILFLYGPQWAPSIPVTRVLMLIGIPFSTYYFYGNVIKAAGKPAIRLRIQVLTAVLNVVGFAVAVRWGIVAVAASYVTVGYLILPVYFWVIRDLIRDSFRAHLRQYLPALGGSMAMIAVLTAVKAALGAELGLVVRVSLLVASGAAAYLLALRLIQPSLSQRLIRLAALAIPGLRSRAH